MNWQDVKKTRYILIDNLNFFPTIKFRGYHEQLSPNYLKMTYPGRSAYLLLYSSYLLHNSITEKKREGSKSIKK